MKRVVTVIAGALLTSSFAVFAAETMSTQSQIAEAVSPLPESLRAGATVVTYDASGNPEVLRKGTNAIVCQPDQPTPGFSVSCYHKVLAPQRDVEAKLRAEGKEQKDIQAAVAAARESGKLAVPPTGTMMYSRSGKTAEDAKVLWVMLVPNATPEMTGLPTERGQGTPWMMRAGTPGAHIMMPQSAPMTK
jgi:hypothetical protein